MSKKYERTMKAIEQCEKDYDEVFNEIVGHLYNLEVLWDKYYFRKRTLIECQEIIRDQEITIDALENKDYVFISDINGVISKLQHLHDSGYGSPDKKTEAKELYTGRKQALTIAINLLKEIVSNKDEK